MKGFFPRRGESSTKLGYYPAAVPDIVVRQTGGSSRLSGTTETTYIKNKNNPCDGTHGLQLLSFTLLPLPSSKAFLNVLLRVQARRFCPRSCSRRERGFLPLRPRLHSWQEG